MTLWYEFPDLTATVRMTGIVPGSAYPDPSRPRSLFLSEGSKERWHFLRICIGIVREVHFQEVRSIEP